MSVFSNRATSAAEQAKAYVTAVLHMLGDRDPIQVLRQQKREIEQALAGLSDEQSRTPEAPGKWSMVQVVQHLADSELVWAYRLRMVVTHDAPELTGYDQDLWADRLNYSTASVQDALAQFTVLRSANLKLLESLSESDMQRVARHNERGEESIAYMVRLYAGHDLVHRQQLLRIRNKTMA